MIILASASPRRAELLKRITETFIIQPTHTDESLPDGIHPRDAVLDLSYRKASSLKIDHPEDLIIGSDTIVALESTILGKPENEKEAFQMLRMLSGRTHQVYTGVTLIQGNRSDSFAVCSDVTFYSLSDEEIAAYIQTGEPMDKAGAYGIQGLGGLLVEKINGDYYNIVGLPIAALKRRLNDFNNFL